MNLEQQFAQAAQILFGNKLKQLQQILLASGHPSALAAHLFGRKRKEKTNVAVDRFLLERAFNQSDGK